MKFPSEPVFDVESSRLIEQAAAAFENVPLHALMERAGQAALKDLLACYPLMSSLTIVCGVGNNGGDGYVLARLALAAGLSVTVCAPAGLPASADAQQAAQAFLKVGVLTPFDARLASASDVLVDALFGSGVNRPLSSPWVEVVAALNASGRPIYSLDIPSGLHADTGEVLGVAVNATRTLALLTRKPGYFLGQGPDCVGVLGFDDLAVSPRVLAGFNPQLSCLSDACRYEALPKRARLSHKGVHGHVLVVAGGPGMAGAAALAAQAALRCGAGLVTVATHPSNVAIVAAGMPELMVIGVTDPSDLATVLSRADVIAAGPGLGASAWASRLLSVLMAQARALVLDADALNWLAAQPLAPWAPAALCLTPHPGEAARLLRRQGMTSAAVQASRLPTVEALAASYNAVVVLKGAASLIAVPGQTPSVCAHGNPGMGSAGMGDVLTGIISGIAAQQPDRATQPALALSRAAKAGVLVHALAADRAANAGERGLIASDVVANLRAFINPSEWL